MKFTSNDPKSMDGVRHIGVQSDIVDDGPKVNELHMIHGVEHASDISDLVALLEPL